MMLTFRTGWAIAALASVASVIPPLAGCFRAGAGSDASKTLTVQCEPDVTNRHVVETWVTLFKNKYPDIRVVTQLVSVTAKQGTNLRVLTSNEAPDVCVLPLESFVYSEMSKAKTLVPLRDVYKTANLEKRYMSTTIAAVQYNGVPLAVPTEAVFYNAVFYNKSLFKRLRIAEPADHRFNSLKELDDTVAALKAGNVQGIAVGAADNYQSSWMIDASLPNTSREDQYTNYLSNWQKGVTPEVSYLDAPFVSSVTRVKTLADHGAFQSGYLASTVSDAEALFEQEKTGLVLGGSWWPATFTKDNVSFDYDWALLPPVNIGKKMVLSSYLGKAYGIPVKAKNIEMAKRFLEIAMSVEGQKGFLRAGLLPIVYDVPKELYASMPPAVQSMIADVAVNGAAVGWSDAVPPTVGANGVEPVLQEMLNGKGTPRSVAQSVEDALKKLKA